MALALVFAGLFAINTARADTTASVSVKSTSEALNRCLVKGARPCIRSGTCKVAGSDWDAYITVFRKDPIIGLEWREMCALMAQALVDGHCQPTGAAFDVIIDLSKYSYADIPKINGDLVCGAGANQPGQ